jgi:predicted negative regulator of RcsB-dependent stress response
MDTTLLCIVVPIIGIFAILGGRWYQRHALDRTIAAAQARYQRTLAHLKADPANADLREHTLAVGRWYAGVARQQTGTTIFDEMALMNDISAATAGRNAPSPPDATTSAEQRLQHLGDLRERGLITDEEYAARRQAIIEGV